MLKRFVRVPLLTALIALMASVAATNVIAQDSPVLDRIVETSTLRVGMSGSQPPFNMKGRDGALMGLEVDLATALAMAMKAELEIVEKPFAEMIPALEKGDVDMVLMDAASSRGYIGANPDKLEVVGDPLGTEEFGFIFTPGSDLVKPFNAAIQTMKEDGFLDQSNNRWFFMYEAP